MHVKAHGGVRAFRIFGFDVISIVLVKPAFASSGRSWLSADARKAWLLGHLHTSCFVQSIETSTGLDRFLLVDNRREIYFCMLIGMLEHVSMHSSLGTNMACCELVASRDIVAMNSAVMSGGAGHTAEMIIRTV